MLIYLPLLYLQYAHVSLAHSRKQSFYKMRLSELIFSNAKGGQDSNFSKVFCYLNKLHGDFQNSFSAVLQINTYILQNNNKILASEYEPSIQQKKVMYQAVFTNLNSTMETKDQYVESVQS